MAGANRTLGRFHLEGIPAAPRGIPKIEVAFDIDANGILHVNAKDTATAKEQKITITASTGLGKEEIDRMVKEAETHSSEDRKRKAVIEARNHLDSLIYNTEKTLRESREKIPGDIATEVEAAVTEARESMKSEDETDLKQAAEKLMQHSHRLAEHMYKEASASASPPPPQGEGESTGTEGEVVDAEYEDPAKK